MPTILIGFKLGVLSDAQLDRVREAVSTTGAFEVLLDNLRRYRAGQPLRNVVDKRLGY